MKIHVRLWKSYPNADDRVAKRLRFISATARVFRVRTRLGIARFCDASRASNETIIFVDYTSKAYLHGHVLAVKQVRVLVRLSQAPQAPKL